MLNLPASPVARRNTAAAIVDQQYCLLPSVLVSTGLMQQMTNVTSCIPKSWHNDLLVVEAAACRYYEGSDFQLWAQMFWMVLTGELRFAAASPTLVLEWFEEDMIFDVYTPCSIVDLEGQSRDVIKRYNETAREIFAFR
ncbi:hypothetical protein DYB28_002527 [Aphanomyces astaci]|uniref:Uncharacterized protein n=1 Tax=Aphanomyces astaci TaxID=112090 RepID=A0A9X8E8H9_APHAT|nr:hypothetical protein DYB28_002527 [Aphanomyces astaci]